MPKWNGGFGRIYLLGFLDKFAFHYLYCFSLPINQFSGHERNRENWTRGKSSPLTNKRDRGWFDINESVEFFVGGSELNFRKSKSPDWPHPPPRSKGSRKKVNGNRSPGFTVSLTGKTNKEIEQFVMIFPDFESISRTWTPRVMVSEILRVFRLRNQPLVSTYGMIDFSICLFVRIRESVSFETQPTIIFIAVASDWNWNRDISRFPGFMNKRGTFKSFLMRSSI